MPKRVAGLFGTIAEGTLSGRPDQATARHRVPCPARIEHERQAMRTEADLGALLLRGRSVLFPSLPKPRGRDAMAAGL